MTVAPLLMRCMPCCKIITGEYYLILDKPMCIECYKKTLEEDMR